MILCQKWHTSADAPAPKVAPKCDLVPKVARQNAVLTCNA